MADDLLTARQSYLKTALGIGGDRPASRQTECSSHPLTSAAGVGCSCKHQRPQAALIPTPVLSAASRRRLGSRRLRRRPVVAPSDRQLRRSGGSARGRRILATRPPPRRCVPIQFLVLSANRAAPYTACATDSPWRLACLQLGNTQQHPSMHAQSMTCRADDPHSACLLL